MPFKMVLQLLCTLEAKTFFIVSKVQKLSINHLISQETSLWRFQKSGRSKSKITNMTKLRNEPVIHEQKQSLGIFLAERYIIRKFGVLRHNFVKYARSSEFL